MSGSKRVLQRLTASNDNSLQPDPSNRAGPSHRPDPKSKKIQDRVLRPQDLKIIQRPERSWSQQQKIRVLVFLYHHRIMYQAVGRHDSVGPEHWQSRPPTQQEASKIYGVPQKTISNWVRMQDSIESHSSRAQIPRMMVMCQWPELESRLYCLFLEWRERGQGIRTGWFRVNSL